MCISTVEISRPFSSIAYEVTERLEKTSYSSFQLTLPTVCNGFLLPVYPQDTQASVEFVLDEWVKSGTSLNSFEKRLLAIVSSVCIVFLRNLFSKVIIYSKIAQIARKTPERPGFLCHLWRHHLQSPETFRADLGHDNSLCILKTKKFLSVKLYYTFNSSYLKDKLNNSFVEWLVRLKSFLGFRETGPSRSDLENHAFLRMARFTHQNPRNFPKIH